MTNPLLSPDSEPLAAGGQARNSAILITGAGGEVGHGLIEAIHAEGRRNIVALDIRKLGRDLRSKCVKLACEVISEAARTLGGGFRESAIDLLPVRRSPRDT